MATLLVAVDVTSTSSDVNKDVKPTVHLSLTLPPEVIHSNPV